MEFTLRAENSYHPQWGDINWHARYERSRLGEDAGLELWLRERAEEPLVQVTQDNCMVEVNQTAPEMDRILLCLKDKKGKDRWIRWFRGECGDEVFSTTLERVQAYATYVESIYPRQKVVEMFLGVEALALAGLISQWEKVPDQRKSDEV